MKNPQVLKVVAHDGAVRSALGLGFIQASKPLTKMLRKLAEVAETAFPGLKTSIVGPLNTTTSRGRSYERYIALRHANSETLEAARKRIVDTITTAAVSMYEQLNEKAKADYEIKTPDDILRAKEIDFDQVADLFEDFKFESELEE